MAAVAQQPAGLSHIGVLMGSSPSDEATKLDAFRGALEKLGYIDGQTILIEALYAMGQPDRFASLARELVALAPPVIACVGSPGSSRAAGSHAHDPDRVYAGQRSRRARPCRLAGPAGRQHHRLYPNVGRARSKTVAVAARDRAIAVACSLLVNPNLTPSLLQRFAGAEAAAKSLGISLRRVDATTSADLAVAFAAIEESSSEALLVQSDPMLTGTEFSRILEFILSNRLPTVIEAHPTSVPLGVLLSYGPDLIENARLAAGYVAKVLKGAKPADLPVQQPTKFRLIVNLKTANAIGLRIPPSILARADEVIE